MKAYRLLFRQWLYAVHLAVGMLLFVCAFSFMDAVSRSITFGLDRFGSDVIVVSKPEIAFTNGQELATLDHSDVTALRSVLQDRFFISAAARSVSSVSLGPREELATIWSVEPGFFATAGLRITRGRDFSDFEAASRADVCLLSEETSRSLTGDGHSAPQQIALGDRACRVIGVVSSSEIMPNFSVAQAVYVPFGSGLLAGPKERAPVTQIFLRHINGPPDTSMADTIRATVGASRHQEVDIWFAGDFWRLRSAIANSLWVLVLLLSCVILGMAALSLANALTVDVLQRRGEIGLRIALGATRRDIFLMFLGQGLVIVTVGGLAGAAGGAILCRYVLSPLIGNSDLLASEMVIDGATLFAAIFVLTATSAIACLVPARQAMKVDPSLAIRSL